MEPEKYNNPDYIYANIVFLTNFSLREIDSGNLIKLRLGNYKSDPVGSYVIDKVLKSNYGIKNGLIKIDYETSFISDPDRNMYQLTIDIIKHLDTDELREVQIFNEGRKYFKVKNLFEAEDDEAALLIYEVGE